MRILVFGRNGQIARCIAQEAAGVELITLDRQEADLMRAGVAQAAITSHAPDIVINAAAYTAVDKAEDDFDAAHRLNAVAPGEMADAAKNAGANFIHISTDYVFDGAATAPYVETDTTNPVNVYGQTKLEGENAVLGAYEQAVILRTSWIFSDFGANFVKTMLRLSAEHDALNIVDDQVGGPTSARDIAKAILTIAAKKSRGAEGAGLYHYQGRPPSSWAQFAAKIFEIADLAVEISPTPTIKYPTPAERPLYSQLNCARIERDFGIAMPDWRIELRRTIHQLTNNQH